MGGKYTPDRAAYMRRYWRLHPDKYEKHKKWIMTHPTRVGWPRGASSIVKDVVRRELNRAIREAMAKPPRRAPIKIRHPIPPSDKISISRAKHVYTMKEVTMIKMKKQHVNLNCYYHEGDIGKEIKVGDYVFSGQKTRTRTFVILAHVECALKKNVLIPEDLMKEGSPKGVSQPAPLNPRTSVLGL